MMNPEIKAKWVEALRSGKYNQGTGYLKSDDGCHCCLGVLSELNGEPHSSDGVEGASRFLFPDNYSSFFSVPDDYCGISVIEMCNLIDMNDGNHQDVEYGDFVQKTFPEIADYIEKNL